MNYLIKSKKIDYLRRENKNEVYEEKATLELDQDNLTEIIKEIDKEPIPYNEKYFIDRDLICFKPENKADKKKNKKGALLQDLIVRPREKMQKEEQYAVFEQLNDLDEEYKKYNNK
jgi:hypothetical protein